MNRFCSFSALALSLTCAYGAETKQPMHGSADVYLSSPEYYFEMGGSALFLQPTASNMHYIAEADPLPVPTPNWKIFDIDTDYHAAFDVELVGHSHCTHTNLGVKWLHFSSDDTASKTIPAQNMVGPFFTIGPDASPYNSANGKVKYRFDKVDANFGLQVNFGSRTRTNFTGGVGYAYLKQTQFTKYSNPTGTITRSIDIMSKFSGAGPQAGVDCAFRIWDGLHFIGDSSASLLVGSMHNDTTYKSTSPLLSGLNITPPNTQTTQVNSQVQVVPAFTGKLGLDYECSFWTHCMLALEAGYQAQIYLNMIQSVDMGSEVPLNSVAAASVGVYARTFTRTLSNFALAGPYITLRLAF